MKTLPDNMDFTLNDLNHYSKDWDKRTKTIFLFVTGYGNMFGGTYEGYIITLHGENSIQPTGTITVKRRWKSSTNIARGDNGPDSGHLVCYDPITGIKEEDFSCTGSCNVELLATSHFNAKKEWLIGDE